MRPAQIALALALLHAPAARADEPANPNELFAAGTPTFVLGTAGDARADAEIEAQARSIRDLLFPAATCVADTSIDPAKGPEAWPKNPVLYGGPHVNALLSRLSTSLPFEMAPGRLRIGDRTFEGDEYRLIALIPARPNDDQGPGHPAFVLYAGAGTPGTANINAVRHGSDPIVIGDRFGPLVAGKWTAGSGGRLEASFEAERPRIRWRATEVSPALRVERPGVVKPTAAEQAENEACLRALERVKKMLNLAEIAPLTIHVYPDHNSKQSLTLGGDGHADVASRTLHVVAFDAAKEGPLEGLVAHEATHVLATDAFGMPGSALLGEGLAVWVAGRYGGKTLAAHRGSLAPLAPVADLLGRHGLEESVAYPAGGLLVEALVALVGLEKTTKHLLPATAATWEEACTCAGTTTEEVEKAFRAACTGGR